MQTNWACITIPTMEYAWAMDHMSESLCPITTLEPEIYPCVERQQQWNDEIAQANCGSADMGVTNKGSHAIVCAGYEDYQYKLGHSLANWVFLSCDA